MRASYLLRGIGLFCAIAIATGCSKKLFPDEKDTERVFRAIVAGKKNKSKDFYEIVKFEKTNGFEEKSFFGREMYYAEYIVIFFRPSRSIEKRRGR